MNLKFVNNHNFNSLYRNIKTMQYLIYWETHNNENTFEHYTKFCLNHFFLHPVQFILNRIIFTIFILFYSFLDDVDSSVNTYRSVARRKTDLMPTVPNTRDRSFYGSRSSLGSLTPRSPGM